jgi:hypothetical protein
MYGLITVIQLTTNRTKLMNVNQQIPLLYLVELLLALMFVVLLSDLMQMALPYQLEHGEMQP